MKLQHNFFARPATLWNAIYENRKQLVTGNRMCDAMRESHSTLDVQWRFYAIVLMQMAHAKCMRVYAIMHQRFGIDVNLELKEKWANNKKKWFERLYLSQNGIEQWWVLRAENAGCMKSMCAPAIPDLAASHCIAPNTMQTTASRLTGMSDKRIAVYVYILS